MTAAEKAFVGFAKQTAKGTPNTTDASFKYVLFRRGGLASQSSFLPLDMEVGGGALQRNIVKSGVMSGGRLNFIPRPASLGDMLYGLTGKVTTTDLTGAYSHLFELDPDDNFAAPYYTGRQDLSGLTAEQFKDMRFSSLMLSWRAGRFLEGEVTLVGGLPSIVATTTWDALDKVDGGPQFLAPLSKIEVPDATALKVIAGSFAMVSAIPMDQQWIVGSYSPDDFSITQRSFALMLRVKIEDATLFKKIQYDPAAGSAWVASAYAEANTDIKFVSNVEAKTGTPYSLTIAANSQTAASGDANIIWSANPVELQAGTNIIMDITGTFVADADATHDPVAITLINQVATY